MPSATSLAINVLPRDTSYDKAERLLFPLLTKAEEKDGSVQVDEGVTPLMVACDKGQIETVRFLLFYRRRSKRAASLVGHIRQKCIETGNTAIHFAAMSGEKEILKELSMMEQGNPSDDYDEETLSSPLHALTNLHGDTPLMMACAHGRIDLLEYWLPLIADKHTALSKRNQSDDSAISLAAAHGYREIFDLLVKSSLDVKYKDLRLAEMSLESAKELYNKHLRHEGKNSDSATLDRIKDKIGGIRYCTNELQKILQKKADDAAKDLASMQSSPPQVQKKAPSKKSKVRKKRISNNSSQKGVPTSEKLSSDNESTLGISENATIDEQSHKNSQMSKQRQCPDNKHKGSSASTALEDEESDENELLLTHLGNGTRAVAVKGVPLEEEKKEEKHPITMASSLGSTPCHKSAEDVFRDQFFKGDEKVKDLMEALCVDVSHLVLPAPKMAFNLSACQLDAVEAILEHQKAALMEARAIQARLQIPETFQGEK